MREELPITITRKGLRWIGVLMLLCGVFGGVYAYSAARALEDVLFEALQQLADEAALSVSAELEKRTLLVETIAKRPNIRSMAWELQKPVLEEEAKRLGIVTLAVVLPDGTAKYPAEPDGKVGDRAYVKAAFEGKTSFSDVLISRQTGTPVMMLATPIKSPDHGIAGVLIARLDALFLSLMTESIKYGQEGYSFMLDEKGTVIAHPNRNFVSYAANFLEQGQHDPQWQEPVEMMRRMVQGERGVDEYHFVGRDRLFGFAPIPGSAWSIAVGAMKDEAFAVATPMRVSGALALAALLGAFVFVARAFRRSVVAGRAAGK